MGDFNGWKNYETWNVALWIENDEGLYNLARSCRNYSQFKNEMKSMQDTPDFGSIAYSTPDNVAWDDCDLDIDALDEMIEEL